jgi:putative acetyltransferase
VNGTLIRLEEPRDFAAIHDLTRRAFAPMPFSAGDEQDGIDRPRKVGALTRSIVADQGGRVVGHVAFSPAFAEDGSDGWFALGPISPYQFLRDATNRAASIKTSAFCP